MPERGVLASVGKAQEEEVVSSEGRLIWSNLCVLIPSNPTHKPIEMDHTQGQARCGPHAAIFAGAGVVAGKQVYVFLCVCRLLRKGREEWEECTQTHRLSWLLHTTPFFFKKKRRHR